MGNAYFIPDGEQPPGLPDGQEWQVLRVQLGWVCTTQDGQIPDDTPGAGLTAGRPMTLVATDSAAANAAIAEKVDALFTTMADRFPGP